MILFSDVEASVLRWQDQVPKPEELFRTHSVSVENATRALRAVRVVPSAKPDVIQLFETAKSAPTAINFSFEGSDGTRLTDASNLAGEAKWSASIRDSSVQNGKFLIRRNRLTPVTAYTQLEPYVMPGKTKAVDEGFLVVKIGGWNLLGETLGEEVRLGFTSRLKSTFHTATFSLVRTDTSEVTLRGIAFGSGSTDIEQQVKFPAKQTKPITFVIELDKVEGNPDEGDSGGRYRVHYRVKGDETFTQLGDGGLVRRRRNGKYIQLRCAGRFAAKGEHFEIDQIYYTTSSPFAQ